MFSILPGGGVGWLSGPKQVSGYVFMSSLVDVRLVLDSCRVSSGWIIRTVRRRRVFSNPQRTAGPAAMETDPTDPELLGSTVPGSLC